MKKRLRVLPFLFLLLLGAIALPGGSKVGAAIDGPASQKDLPPGSAEIVSFTATPASVLRGESATLSWRVANARHIWISRLERPDAVDCIKEQAGEMQVTPLAETTYTLNVWAGSTFVSKPITVGVREPSGVCRISGTVAKNKADYSTRVELYAGTAPKPMFSTGVDSAGAYGFKNVPEGRYRVVVRGKFPVDEFAIGPIPRSQDVLCQPNKSVPDPVNFRIGSTEG